MPSQPAAPVKEEEAESEGEFVAPALNAASQTVYINNINEKIKLTELKKTLATVFGEYGKILQIVAMSSLARRGQAFIVFGSVESAQKAVDARQGFLLRGKRMRVNFAKATSDAVAKANGTFQPRQKKPLPPKKVVKRRHSSSDESDGEDEQNPPKRAPPAAEPSRPAPPRPPPKPVTKVEENPPNRILKLSGLPNGITNGALQSLFSQFPGFKEVRLVPGLYDIGFVEYETDMHAVVAKTSLQGAMLDEQHPLVMNYAKK